MEANFFGPSDLISIGFLAAFSLVGDINQIYDGAAMWVLPSFVNSGLAMMLASQMSAETYLAPVIALVYTVEPKTQENEEQRDAGSSLTRHELRLQGNLPSC